MNREDCRGCCSAKDDKGRGWCYIHPSPPNACCDYTFRCPNEPGAFLPLRVCADQRFHCSCGFSMPAVGAERLRQAYRDQDDEAVKRIANEGMSQ